MAPPNGAILPVITKVCDDAGVFVGDAQELRIKAPMTALLVTGNFPPRIEIALPVSSAFPPIVPVYQRPMTAAAPGRSVIAFASLDGTTHFLAATYYPDSSVTHNAVNYTGVALYDADDFGTETLIAGTAADTSVVDWASGGQPAFELALGADIAEGHKVVARWSKYGTGVANPGGVWRVK